MNFKWMPLPYNGYGGYSANDGGIYFTDGRMISNTIKYFRVATGTLDSRLYARDDEHVYFQGSIVTNEDPISMYYISDGGMDGCVFFSKDATHVYLAANPPVQDIAGENAFDDVYTYATPESFKYVDAPDGSCTGFESDGNFVFYVGVRSPTTADAASFLALGGAYAKDKNHAYWGLAVIPDVDLESFKVLEEPDGSPSRYAEDKRRVYFSSDSDAGPTTTIVIGADVQSFSAVRDNGVFDAVDANHKYSWGKAI